MQMEVWRGRPLPPSNYVVSGRKVFVHVSAYPINTVYTPTPTTTPTLTPTATATYTHTATPVPAQSGRINVLRFKGISNIGGYSEIETGDPTIRSDPTGQWSYMRLGAQRIIKGNVYYIEIGWLKGAQSQSNFIPRSYWASRNINGITDQDWGGYPGIGIAYNYVVKKTSSNTWSFYFNDLNTPVATVWVGWDNADRIFSGGEIAGGGNQGMGYSENNNVQFLDPMSSSWLPACNTSLQNDDPAKFFVLAGSNCNSWIVYGNN